jgi:transposase-like protein
MSDGKEKNRMTALDRTLATTFRAARWPEGRPVCPSCFDGDDLDKPTPDPYIPELSRYRCLVCHGRFSDVKGTAFRVCVPASLAILAHLVLAQDPRLIDGLSPVEVNRYWGTVERIRRSVMAANWRGELERATITLGRLAKQIRAQRRTA